MLGALMTKKIFLIMESFQIIIVILLMIYFKKNLDELFLYIMVSFSLVIYVYAVISLNGKNGEEAYKNAYIMHLTSSIDGLSGLLNRRTWYEKSEKFFNIDDNYAFIMLDIDHFKKINDTYGHDAGDIVIQEISNILLHQSRDNDIVGRLGGEEFGIFLIDSLTENTIEIAKRIKDNIENHTIHYNNNIIKMTASFGIALKNKHSSNFKDFIKLGDINLYEAKQNGRNKIVF